MTYYAEYHVRENFFTEFIRVLSETMQDAAKKFFDRNVSCEIVEVRILGGNDWKTIRRDEV